MLIEEEAIYQNCNLLRPHLSGGGPLQWQHLLFNITNKCFTFLSISLASPSTSQACFFSAYNRMNLKIGKSKREKGTEEPHLEILLG